MSRRVRRDSETSTDSWSLVSEDRLDDDFSLNSTDNEEAIETEPIIEEPLTSDEEEEEDTASEKSLDSESEDSSDSESEASEASDLSEHEDVEEEIEEGEEALEKAENSEDSDLSDADSLELSDEENVSDEEEDEEEVEKSGEESEIDDEIYEIGEGEEIAARSEAEAALKCKEDMEWMYEEIGDIADSPARKIIRVLFAFSLFLVLFPLAEIFTCWMLNVKLHRTPQVEYSTLVFDGYSPQSYDAEKRSFVYKTKEESEESLRQWRRQQKSTRNTLHLLEKILMETPEIEEVQPKEKKIKEWSPVKIEKIQPIRSNRTIRWSFQQTENPDPELRKAEEEFSRMIDKIEEIKKQETLQNPYSNFKSSRQNFRAWKCSNDQCRALAPVPPAPFSPRKSRKVQYPQHQPCFVHVNQSKWTCQKNLNLPSVIYSSPNFTVIPREFSVPRKQKQKAWGNTSARFQKTQKYDICGKKASESMRTISKPTDTCHSRQLSKFTPRGVSKHAPRKHIAFKAPLPCKIPTYKPTIPKKTVKPSTSSEDDWIQKRSYYRAQHRQNV